MRISDWSSDVCSSVLTTSIPRYVVDTSDLEAYGLDFDTRWQATDGLALDFNASYIDSTYKDYITPEGIDVSGQPTGIPNWSAAIGRDYPWRMNDAGDLRFTLDRKSDGEGKRVSVPL